VIASTAGTADLEAMQVFPEIILTVIASVPDVRRLAGMAQIWNKS
jgi:hypothetical protein